jgi:hypothetical protein
MPSQIKLVYSFILLIATSNCPSFCQAFTAWRLSTASRPQSKSAHTTYNNRMTAKDIDGKSIAATIREELANKLSSLPPNVTTRPGLAVMLVGSRKDSQTYVRMKQKACADCGMESFLEEYPNGEEVTEETLLAKIREWNEDDKVHGILVQLPLPHHISEEKILREVDAKKVCSIHYDTRLC